ncbi:efflux RND transporter periplasmic adaptor subunit [Lyngbya aestuarii]|uniref:efflux RND transporter periplasmic adaptor subunit n=1 Tax=Lyngbya aestuarii TaxID=118322 RepID=UPI00403E1558
MNYEAAERQNSPDLDLVPEKEQPPLPEDEIEAVAADQFKKQPKFTRLVVLGVGAIALTLGLVTGWKHLKSSAPQTAETPAIRILPVKTLQVEPVASYQVSRTYTGEIAAHRTSSLGFEGSGKLVLINVTEGEQVTAGTALAKLDVSNLETQRLELLAQKAQAVALLEELQAGPRSEKIAAARAAVRNLEEQLKLERTKRFRRENLYAEGAISQEQLDEVSFNSNALAARLEEAQSNLYELQAGTRSEQIAAQQAAVRQLEARLADLEVTIGKSTIKAPFSGTIAARLVDEGTVVSAGQAVVRLVENAKPEARIGVPAIVASELTVGSKHQLRVGQETYEARVSSILPEVNPTTRTQTILLTLEPSAAPVVTSGQTAHLEINKTIPTDGYWLPTEALVQGERGLWSCYVLVEVPREASAELPQHFRVTGRTLEILHTESDRVLVRGTLQPRDRVVESGTHRLVSGQLVRPAEF